MNNNLLAVRSILCLCLFFLPATVGLAQRLPESAELTRRAWLALQKGENPDTSAASRADAMKEAIRLADLVISKYKATARRKQKELSEDIKSRKTQAPPKGKVTKVVFEKVMANGPINDVAACYMIKGKAHLALQDKEQALAAFKAGKELFHARVWDANSPKPGWNSDGWLWEPAESCAAEIEDLQNK